MDNKKIKIASVSYLNSVPFTYGIESSQLIDADLTLATPSECVRLFADREVDVALIPSIAIKRLGIESSIVTSHCIGAVGAVRTVVMMSDEPIDQIKCVWLDGDSQTSVQLLAQLCESHFDISPKWRKLSDMNRLQHPEDGDAFLLIGDKVFSHEGEFEYTFDLAEEWIKMTDKPFVFAAWCAHEGVSEESLEQLEEALTWGVEHTYEALLALRPDIEMEDGYRYLTENIDTLLDSAKRAGVAQFWSSEVQMDLSTER